MDKERRLANKLNKIYGIRYFELFSFKSLVSLYKNREVIKVKIQDTNPKNGFFSVKNNGWKDWFAIKFNSKVYLYDLGISFIL